MPSEAGHIKITVIQRIAPWSIILTITGAERAPHHCKTHCRYQNGNPEKFKFVPLHRKTPCLRHSPPIGEQSL